MNIESEEISEIFREVYPNLCRFLESIVGKGRQAQDLAQESFMRLCKADFGDISSAEIRYWLFRVARNLALNEISKEKTQEKFWYRLTELFSRRQADPAETIIESENKKLIKRFLDELPEHQRSALILREQEEMSYRQIAQVLNISESKVKVDIFRARQALREQWLEHEKQGETKL